MIKEADPRQPLIRFTYLVGRDEETSLVPFTQDEIDTLAEMKKLFGQGHFNASNSGYARELSSRVGIPWGRALKNRPQALNLIQKSLREVERALKIDHVQINRIRPQLRSLQEGLSSFLK